jgi:hypothetical protein
MRIPGLLILFFFLISCTDRNSKKSFPAIDLENPNNARDLYLSELLSDIHIVRLETSDEILLGQNTNYLVGEKYIITIDYDKILQFSNTGKFLKTLAKAGKGPDEFMRADAFALDEKNDILYINHRGDYHNIIVFDLNNGSRVKRFPSGVDNIISKIIVLNDSVLTIVPRMNKDFNLYYLTTSGEILNGIAPPEVKGIGLETSIEKVQNEIYYMPKEYDTLYLLNGTTCNPYCFFHVEDRFTFENNETGNFVYLSANAPGFMIANKAHARIRLNDDGETYSMNADKLARYFINKNDFSVCEIKDFSNDFLGFDEDFDPWNTYLFITNDLGFVSYSSFELKQKIEKTLETKRLDNVVKQRISLLNQRIIENDNPVLVIGKLKKN